MEFPFSFSLFPFSFSLSAIALFLSSLLVIFLTRAILKALPSRRRGLPLPPGTMGWPYVGETFQLYSQNPNTFFNSKQARFGPIFKTHVLGCPCVMISSPEAARFVLVTMSHLFKPTYPASKERMLGKQAIFFHQGEYHTKLRKLVLRAFLPDAIRNRVSDIEPIAVNCLRSLEGRVVNTFQEMKTYSFNVALLAIFGKDEVKYREGLNRCYYVLEKGYNSMPINLPGTLFHKSMKARKELAHILEKIILARRQMKFDRNDLLGSFMADTEGLTDEQIADNVIGVIFAARDTTASVITWIIKYLAENPSVLKAVTEEQEAVMRSKEGVLTWGDTKNMPLTTRVIQETLRVASILSFTFREAVEDVEYEGFLIPKGWKVLPLFRIIHHSPENFPEPEKFDPSRFEVAPKPNTYLPFGNGIHSCPGNELAKLEILVLLHHLTTKYRWSLMGSQNGIQYAPFALPQNGLPMKYSFNVALLSIFGKDEVKYREGLNRCYYVLEKGYNSMPINLPGTLFHKSMKARKELAHILEKIILARRQMKFDHNDLLGSFMADTEGLTDEQIADNVIGVIFAARDTTASVMTWIIKYLAENPSVLKAVTEEQEAVMRSIEGVLTWGDTKNMPMTTRVIQETLRVASILSFTFREAVEDVEYEGFLIPKGWKVLPLFRIIHHSPENFPEPEKFDPSRFEVAPKPNTYLPFGNGIHSCPGNELAKLEILVLLHHLTTKYRWSLMGSQNGIQYAPFALPQNGLPMKLSLNT